MLLRRPVEFIGRASPRGMRLKHGGVRAVVVGSCLGHNEGNRNDAGRRQAARRGLTANRGKAARRWRNTLSG